MEWAVISLRDRCAGGDQDGGLQFYSLFPETHIALILERPFLGFVVGRTVVWILRQLRTSLESSQSDIF